MDSKQAIKASFIIPDTRKAFIVKKYGGYCSHVNLEADCALVLAAFEEDRPGVQDEIIDYPFYRLVYTSKGSVKLNDRKKDYLVTPGTIYSFKPGESSYAECFGDSCWAHYILNFTGPESATLIESSNILSQRVINVKFPEQAEAIMNFLINESLKQTASSQIVCEYYLRIILIKLKDWVLEHSPQLSVEYQKFLMCKDYITRNFDSLNSIEFVADSCNISKQHLCRLFKKYHNCTALHYLHKLKINRIAVLLLETNLPINEIASNFSYQDSFYFSKVFKKYYGISPREYRRKNKMKSHLN